MELSADYEAEQAELKKRAAALQAELSFGDIKYKKRIVTCILQETILFLTDNDKNFMFLNIFFRKLIFKYIMYNG